MKLWTARIIIRNVSQNRNTHAAYFRFSIQRSINIWAASCPIRILSLPLGRTFCWPPSSRTLSVARPSFPRCRLHLLVANASAFLLILFSYLRFSLCARSILQTSLASGWLRGVCHPLIAIEYFIEFRRGSFEAARSNASISVIPSGSVQYGLLCFHACETACYADLPRVDDSTLSSAFIGSRFRPGCGPSR